MKVNIRVLVLIVSFLIVMYCIAYFKNKPYQVSYIGCQWSIPAYYEKVNDYYFIYAGNDKYDYTTISFEDNTDKAWTIDTPTEIMDVTSNYKYQYLNIVKLQVNENAIIEGFPSDMVGISTLRIKNDNTNSYVSISGLGDIEYRSKTEFSIIKSDQEEEIIVRCL